MAEALPPVEKHSGHRGRSWSLLVGFVALSLILIVLIWRENIVGTDAGTPPGYYRDTFVIDENVRAAMTAEAATPYAVTPTP